MSATGKFQQPVSGFSPLTFGGCALWLDATSTGNFALTGSNVTTWYDRSGLSNDANSTNGGSPVLSNAAINGLPGVYFSNAPSIGGNLTLSNAGVTGFMVIRPLQTGIGRGDQRIFSAATSGAGDWNADSRFLIGPQGGSTEIRFNRGNTYIPRVNFNASNTYVISWTYDSLSNYLYLNGADADITQGVALSNSAFNTTLYRLGNQVAITSETYNGLIGEVIIYDDYLPHSERRAVEGYLAWKWGIAPSLGTTFSPLTSLSNCAVWFDGADSSTFTLSGSNITQWRDKAGSNTTSNIGTPVYVSNAINGVPGVRLDVNAGFKISPMSNAANTTTVSIYGVVAAGSNPQNNARIFTAGRVADGETNNDYSSSGLWTIYQASSGTPTLTLGHAGAYLYGSNTLSNGVPCLISVVFSGTTVNLWTNGSNQSSNATTNTLVFDRLGIGKNTNPNAGSSYDAWAGNVGEFLIFYSGHTEAQRLQVESYLASKWNIPMRAPLHLVPTHSYTTRKPFLREFLPVDISGCALWLDAGDRSTLTLSSSNTVTGWADKSGNRRTVTMTSGNGTYSSNGFQSLYPTVTFASNQYMTIPLTSTLTNAFTFFVVHEITGSGYVHAFATGSSTSAIYTLFRDDFATYQVGQNNGGSTGNWYYRTRTNRPLVESVVIKPTAPYWNQYLNGVRLVNPNIGGSGTAPASNVGDSNVYIPGPVASGQYAGQICEVLVFSNAFTTSQRQTVERYLAKKWGLAMAMYGSQAHPYRYGPPMGALPVGAPPGCALWLDAADSITLTLSSSNTVTAWADKSGTQRPVVMTSGNGTYSSNGFQGLYPTVSFTTGQFMTATLSAALTNSFTVFIVHQITGTGFNFAFAAGAANSIFYTKFRDDFNTYQIGQDGAGSTGNWYYTTQSNRPLVESIVVKPTTSYWNQYLNGYRLVNPNIGGSGTAPLSNVGSPNVMIPGADTFRGGPTQARYQGQICEVLVFSNAFTDSQRQQVEGYLAAKWGLSSTLDATHPYKTGPQTSITPASIPGCAIWLDATDSASITLSNSIVTQWSDKSGRNAHFVPTASARNASVASNFQNGLSVIDFSGTNFYITPSNTAVYPLDAYIVLAVKSTSVRSDFLAITGTTDNFNALTLGLDGPGNGRWSNSSSFGVRNFSSSSAETSTGFLLMNWSLSNSNYYIRRNGTTIASNLTYTFTPPAGAVFQIGYVQNSNLSPNPDVALRAYMGEMIVYDSQLSTENRQRVEGYLAWKWGIPFQLPGGSSNTAALTRSLMPEFDPRSVGACGAWFDAADASTFIFSSGSNISRWSDKSGLQNHAVTIAGTPTLTVNTLAGRPVVTFTGSQNMRSTYAPATSTTAQTMFVVARPSSISGTQAAITLGPSGSYTNPPPRTSIMFNSNWTTGWFLGADWGGYNGAGTGTAVSTTRTDIVVATWYSGSNGNTSANGTQGPDSTATTPALAVKSATGCLLIGANVDLGVNPTHLAFSGYIAEVLVFGKALTVADRQRIEGYLASKWGLQSQLPALHPYVSTKF